MSLAAIAHGGQRRAITRRARSPSGAGQVAPRRAARCQTVFLDPRGPGRSLLSWVGAMENTPGVTSSASCGGSY